MKRMMIVMFAAALIGTGCVGASYASKDGRFALDGSLLSADGAVKVTHAAAFYDVAGEVGGKKPIFAMNCVDGEYGRGGCIVISNMRGANMYGTQFGNGVIDPYYAGQIAQSRSLGTRSSGRNPAAVGKSDSGGKAGTLEERVGIVEDDLETLTGAVTAGNRKKKGSK